MPGRYDTEVYQRPADLGRQHAHRRGCLGLLLALSGVIDAQVFAVGISSGMRVIGTVAITGCLFSAIGYGLADYFGE